jgi:hypothetical protein
MGRIGDRWVSDLLTHRTAGPPSCHRILAQMEHHNAAKQRTMLRAATNSRSQTTGAAEGFAAAASAASAPSDDRQQQQQKLQQSANASAPLDDPSANLRAHLYRLSWTARQGQCTPEQRLPRHAGASSCMPADAGSDGSRGASSAQTHCPHGHNQQHTAQSLCHECGRVEPRPTCC